MDKGEGVPVMKPKERTPKQRLIDLLEEAITGNSSRSKNTILKEALKIVTDLDC